jgi:SAM-dependent methyltransferase
MNDIPRIRVDAREGYDLWARSYDKTPNPLVALDARYTIAHLKPKAGERILDAGCGTGRNMQALLEAGAEIVGVDFSQGMINFAKQKLPGVSFFTSTLETLPNELVGFDAVEPGFDAVEAGFDAVLCALVGEHLTDLDRVLASFHSALNPGGRITFSVYHPWLAESGVEANFTLNNKEYRLGAETHTIDDYTRAMSDHSFTDISTTVYDVDDWLVERVPAAKYLAKPLLVVITAHKAKHS